MTTLICSTCSDPVEVTATSVVLPFVCLKCEESIKDFEKMLDDSETDKAVEAFYNAMTPASESDAGLLEPGTKGEVASPEDFATVENTTLLIEDLEQQLHAERGLAESLRQNLFNLQEKNDAQRRIIDGMVDYSAKREQAFIVEQLVAAFYKTKLYAMLEELALTKKDLERSGETRAGLEAELVSERSQRTHWQREWKITSTLLSQELDTSLWTRFKEATFDRL